MIRVCFFLGIIITTLFACKRSFSPFLVKLSITLNSLPFSYLKDKRSYLGLTYNNFYNLSVVKIFTDCTTNLSSTSGNILLPDAAETTTAFTSTIEIYDKRLATKLLQSITLYIL